MAELPRDTVTFLFTDIEGSTKLLDELGAESYREALREHRRVLREVFGRHGGYEVDYEGDAFFVAFQEAAAGVAAAREAQAALAEGCVRVRMGLHTGTPLLDPPKYVGKDVHLAARVMSAGHGGQVLLYAGDTRPGGRGRARARGAPVEGFRRACRALPARRRRLSAAEDDLEHESAAAGVELRRPREGGRGGAGAGAGRDAASDLDRAGRVGKDTACDRGSDRARSAFKAGVFWVGLAALRDPALVLETVAQTLGAKGELAVHVGERELLLLLDNLEQVVEVAPELTALVEACPRLVLLVTSREVLRVRGEVDYEVLPLAAPDAVSLFSERAHLPSGPTIEELCRRLDNMPLALELAASRAKALSPREILERLGQRLDLFRGGRDADPRQATLRATIEWSHELLDLEEQALFARLSVFAGGCTLEAAEEVCHADLDLLQSLVEKSLLRHAGERFWMLETIREHSSERLAESGEEEAKRRAHAACYLALAEASRRGLRGPDQAAWLSRILAEEQNLRAALAWAVDRHSAETALRLIWALEVFWIRAARDDEAAQWVDRALAIDYRAQPMLRARALATGGVFAVRMGALELAAQRLGESIPALRTVGDDDGLAFALRGLAWFYEARGETANASAALEEAITLFSALGHPIATRLCDLGDVAVAQGDLARARSSYEQAVVAGMAEGDVSGQAQALSSLSEIAFAEGDLELAERRVRESLEIAVSPADLVLPDAICLLADLTTGRGRPEEAARMVVATERLLADAEPSPATREIQERLGLVAERLRSIDASALDRAKAEGAACKREDLRSWVLGLSTAGSPD